ncbi:MAG: hypothetical protein EBR82_05400 [Caulobacteraceae bacterium]|nr:hypothetical protein [Caulobacteraceae bacterium]
MRYTIDREARIFHLDLNRPVSAQDALEQALALLDAEPDIWTWDWIVHSTVVPEDATVEQIARLARIFATQKGAPATTVLVSDDGYLHLWAKVMDFQFPHRKHLVIRDIAMARDLIFSRRPGKMNRK